MLFVFMVLTRGISLCPSKKMLLLKSKARTPSEPVMIFTPPHFLFLVYNISNFFQVQEFMLFLCQLFHKKQSTGWDLAYLPTLGNAISCQATLIALSSPFTHPHLHVPWTCAIFIGLFKFLARAVGIIGTDFTGVYSKIFAAVIEAQ